MPLSRPALGAACAAALLLATCSTSATPRPAFLGASVQLRPVPGFPDREVDLGPRFDVAAFRALVIDPVQVHPFSAEIERDATPEKLAWLADDLRSTLAGKAAGTYRVVTRPGRGVLRIRSALTDIELRSGEGGGALRPTQGDVKMEFVFLDANTGVRLGAAVLRQPGLGDLGSFSRSGQSGEAFGNWGTRLAAFLMEHDSSREAVPETEGEPDDGAKSPESGEDAGADDGGDTDAAEDGGS